MGVESVSRRPMSAYPDAADNINNFFQAVRKGNLDEVRRYLQAGMYVNVRDQYQQTVLHYAVRTENNREMVAFLLNQPNILIDAVDQFGNTPLLCGIDFQVAKLLLQKGANVHASNNALISFLHQKAALDDTRSVLLALDLQADIEAVTKEKETALHHAAEHGSPQAVLLLLNRGANIEAVSRSRETFIHRARARGRISVIKVMFLSNQRRKIIDYLQKHNFWDTDITQPDIRDAIQNAIRNPVMNLQQIVARNLYRWGTDYKTEKNLPEDVKGKLDNYDFQLLRR